VGAGQVAEPVCIWWQPKLSQPTAVTLCQLPVQSDCNQCCGPESTQPPFRTLSDQRSL